MVEHLTEEVRSKDARIDLLENKLLHVRAEAEAKLQCSQKQMEEVKMIAELNHLQSLENLRQENLLALRREQSIADLERERSEGNLQALTVSFASEKAQLERRVEELNEQIRRLTAMHEYERDDTDIETTSDEEEAEVGGQTPPTVGNATVAMSESAALVSTMAKLLKTQTEAIQAQTQVAATQHLPPLKSFTGEDMQVEEGKFDRWLELFEERAKLTCWGPAQRLHHLKLLLEKTALKAFRTFEVTDREDYDKATAALCKRFKLVDIEELRGLEFHHRMQGKETIEELGMDLQTLGRKAFPSSHGKEFDRLLKGRFFQAIHVKWQRKLGAPKTGETFQELFNRARVLEQHEKQYQESAAFRSGDKQDKPIRPSSQQKGNGVEAY